MERALEKIRSDNEGDLENRELKKLQEEGCVWFEAKTDSLLNLNLGIMLRKIISATKAVESSYQATKQMKKLYNERINNLTEKMLTPHLS